MLQERRMDQVTQHYNAPWWYFSRRDIHAELRRAALDTNGLGRPPRLELGTPVEHVNLASRTVNTSSGRSYEADVIIGADGIRSASGNSVFGKLPTQTQGLSAYRCMVSTERLRDHPETAILVDCTKVLMFMGPDRRIVAYPCSSWDWINFVCIFPDRSVDQRGSQWNTAVTVEEMVERFSDFHPAVTKALSLASYTGVWRLRDRDPLTDLTKDCFALVGDAAHAMGPRGSTCNLPR